VTGESTHAVADKLATDVPIRRQAMVRREPPQSSSTVGLDSQIRRPPTASGLYDVLDLILDKGIVIDAFVRVSLVGIELLTVDLRVVIASVDTYLRYAEGVERLQVHERAGAKKLPDVVGSGMKRHAIKEGAEEVGEAITGRDRENGHGNGAGAKLADGVRHVLTKGVGGLVRSISGSHEEDDSDDERDNDRKNRREDRSSSRHRHRERAGAGR
jgi:gas vesicle structural protein